MLGVLLGVGVWIFIISDFIMIRHPFLIIKKTVGSLFHKKDKKQEGVTAFQAVSTALAGTLGVGSVVGVATAIAVGGPGALFWMWVSALFGMMIKYGEIIVAIQYRRKQKDGTYLGGAMCALEDGCHMPFMAILFSLFCIFASFGIGNLTPANTIASTFSTYFNMDTLMSGILMVLSVGVIIMGKTQKIMRVNEIFVPILSLLYIGAAIYLIALNQNELGRVFDMIFQDAFNFSSAAGGVSGFAISRALHYGISRGVFSNEAGMGSAPLAHASVIHVNAVEQGFWGIFEVFFDTIVVCTISGLLILTSPYAGTAMNGVEMIVHCFIDGFGSIGGAVFSIAIASFALSSMLGWYYYAHQCIRYLFTNKYMIVIYKVIFLALLMVGAMMELDLAWDIADTLNGLMAIPNLISLILLWKVIRNQTRKYMKDMKTRRY